MATIFIFHGTGGYPKENWFPWLKENLENAGCNVIVPQFPTPEKQTLENWLRILKKYQKDISEDTIFVGHSLGGAFLRRVLEQSSITVKAAFTVAAPIGMLPIKNYESDKPFIEHPFDWSKIRAHCKGFYVFHSDNDPYVSLDNGKELARMRDVDLIFMPQCGHFNTAAGFDKFDALLEKIKAVL